MTKIKCKKDIAEKLVTLLESEGFKELKTSTADRAALLEYMREEGYKITIFIYDLEGV